MYRSGALLGSGDGRFGRSGLSREREPVTDEQRAGGRSREDERDLVRRVLRGDRAALDSLHADYADPLFRFVHYRVDGKRSDAEEIVQETFVAAMRGLDRFRGDSALFTWLCGIAKNKIHGLRRQQYRQRLSVALKAVDTDLDLALARLDREPLPDQVVEREETRDLVGAVLGSLPPDYQEVLIDKYYEKTAVNDIAQKIGVSPKAIESRLTRARVAFRKAWEIVAGKLAEDGSPS